jgi:hypothetical protein
VSRAGKISHVFRGPINNASGADCWLNAVLALILSFKYFNMKKYQQGLLAQAKVLERPCMIVKHLFIFEFRNMLNFMELHELPFCM